MPIDMTKITREMSAKALECETAEELMTLAKAEGFTLTKEEAEAYMEDPVLSKRLIEISNALLELDSDDPTEVMGYPDDLKLRSSMTLFSMVSDNPVFQKVLDKFYGGEECSYTREYLR